ncbi:PilZ domain-containing protein [Pseudomonas oligotrophica]|uniref:PilZ domain-containing protein n=1 Tax=Pseudomonas oligotrophica TaxID=2912055 RepID=UPI001F35B8C8|nr:PilZ domain-containing protein [Pseudomonas oligotrophica]MCF7203598.1 PilZ domain-containing protein [Pseudomonas oligotrophica]
MSQNDRQYSEKRDFIRMHIDATAYLRIGERELSATCVDLSSTGMQLLLDEALQPGERVRVLIPSRHSELKGLDAEAEVVRVAEHGNGHYDVGLAIISMS